MTLSVTARRKELKAIIKEHGSPYKAAQALNITPQAFYERMDRVDMPRTKRTIKGEPTTWKEHRTWITNLLKKKHSITAISKHLGCSKDSVQARLKKFGLRSTAARGVEPKNLLSLEQRKKWLEGLMKKYGNACKVAKALNITPAAIYERLNRYGIDY